MKLNKIFMALAAMAIVGCSSDDLSVVAPEQGQAAEDSRLVELNPNFVLAGVGVEDTGTRTHWEQNATTKALQNKFLPIYNATAAAGDMLDEAAELTEQAVGLCWLGQGAVGTDVYTNYQFYHFGWLNNDETKAEVECNVLQNGATYDEIGGLLAVTNGAGGEAKPGTDWNNTKMPTKALVGKVAGGADNLNYNSGVYKTDNKAIFGGKYVVYYPFNEDFKEAGTIPAKAKTTWNNVSTAFNTPELGKETFRYSAPVDIDGGNQAADFGLYNLSSLVQLRVAAATAGDITAGDWIDQIVLYSPSGKLVKEAKLAADQIVAGKKGADLYADKEGTKTITASFDKTDATIWPVLLQVTTSTTITSAYITVLPTTVDDLVVLVHKINGTTGTWARINMGNTVFEAGKAKRLDITVTKDDFKSEFVAVDAASLVTARNEARTYVATNPTATIEVIGDITLDGTSADWNDGATPPTPKKFQYWFDNAADSKITYTGGAIIVPENVRLDYKTNMESDLIVLGKSCCDGLIGGRVLVEGGTLNNVTMKETEANTKNDNNNPEVEFVASTTTTITAGKKFDVQAGNVKVRGTVKHKGDIAIAEKANVYVFGAGDLNFMGGSVDNSGTIEVLKAGNFNMTDSDGNATASDGQRMTNNKTGKFIHNVDAGVGTAVQKMNQNGEYRCRVDAQDKLDDAFLQWKACSVIEMINAGTNYNLGTADGISYQHNGKYIDIEVNTTSLTTFDNPVVASGAGDNKVIQVGNLTVTAGGLNVVFDKSTATVTAKRTLTVNGDMTVKANTTFTDSKKIDIKQNLTVENGATLAYKGNSKNVDGLAVAKDITVSGATFDAGSLVADINALKITCANFYLKKVGATGATAIFGNRSGDGAGIQTMKVTGTIDNGAGCTFTIVGANQDGAGSVLAWVSCSKLIATGTFTGAQPIVE